jgi:hypothetical protein
MQEVCLEDLIKPNQASHQDARWTSSVYAKSTCLGSNYRNSLTLVQKVIPGYLQRTVDNYSRAYLWLLSHDLSHGVPLMLLTDTVKYKIFIQPAYFCNALTLNI